MTLEDSGGWHEADYQGTLTRTHPTKSWSNSNLHLTHIEVNKMFTCSEYDNMTFIYDKKSLLKVINFAINLLTFFFFKEVAQHAV